MRIQRVSAFALESALPCAYGMSTRLQTSRRALLVQVVADTGLEGWGEGSGDVAALARLVNERIGPSMLGSDATGVEGFYAWMRESWPDALSAVGAVDTALWDLRARASGRSLARELGLDLRSSVPAYAAGGYYTEGRVDRGQQLAAAAEAYVAQGFRAVKVKIGRLSVAEDAAALRRLRAAVGPDVRVLTDANEGYGDDLKQALEMAETLSDIDAYWFEEPLSTDHPELYARLRAAIPVPVAGGEHLEGDASYARLLEAGAYDVVQPDVTITGGISGYRAIQALAERHDVHCAAHVWGTPVSFYASLQLVGSIGSGEPETLRDEPMLEYDQGEFPLRDAIGDRRPVGHDGRVALPGGPGTGYAPEAVEFAPFAGRPDGDHAG
jgi:D-galactarolactone cycloisomerase